MLAIRRLYTYGICGISLLLLASGAVNLLELGIAVAVDGLAGTSLVHESGESLRQDISLYLALVAVAVPIWVIHWRLASRWTVRGDSSSDHGSAIRTGYFAAVLAVAIAILSFTVLDALGTTLKRLLDIQVTLDGRETVRGAVISVIALAIWGFHAFAISREFRSDPPSGSASWPPRIYLYGAALIAGFMLLTGLVLILQLPLDAALDRSVFSTDEYWWASTVSTAVPMLIVGGVIWGTHRWYANRLLTRSAFWQSSEAGSRVRGAYHYAFIAAGVFAVLIGSGVAATEILRAALGVEAGTGADPLWARVVEPALVVLPFVGAWWLHLRWVREDRGLVHARHEEPATERLSGYICALTGLSFAAVSTGLLLGLGFEAIFDALGLLDERQASSAEEISGFVSFAAVGTLIWGWHWRRIRERSVSQLVYERRSTSRRAYLYLVLTGTTLALLASSAFALYQVLQLMLGVGSGQALVSDLGVILGIIVVASVLAVYHLRLLRSDMGPSEVIGIEPEPVSGPEAPEPASLILTLTGHGESRLRAILEDLQRQVPADVRLSEAPSRLEYETVQGLDVSVDSETTVELEVERSSRATENGDHGPSSRIPQ